MKFYWLYFYWLLSISRTANMVKLKLFTQRRYLYLPYPDSLSLPCSYWDFSTLLFSELFWLHFLSGVKPQALTWLALLRFSAEVLFSLLPGSWLGLVDVVVDGGYLDNPSSNLFTAEALLLHLCLQFKTVMLFWITNTYSMGYTLWLLNLDLPTIHSPEFLVDYSMFLFNALEIKVIPLWFRFLLCHVHINFVHRRTHCASIDNCHGVH